MIEEAFSACGALQRITGLLDDATPAISRAGCVVTALGTLGGHAVGMAATERSIAGGSLGVDESQALTELLDKSLAGGVPVVLCLDSAGAKLSEGLPALGAFRRMYRHFLDLRLAAIPVLAMVGRDCFGGAAMLASASTRRVYNANSRLAMSGPAVIHALGKEEELDGEAVTLLMGGATRASMQKTDQHCADSLSDYARAALEWLASPPIEVSDPSSRHTELGMRLLAHGRSPGALARLPAMLPPVLAELVPVGMQIRESDGVFAAQPDNSAPGIYFGFLGGRTVDAMAAWTLAGECLAFSASHPGDAVTIFLDSPGHAPTIEDERVCLSDYVAHLALVLAHLRERGHRLTLQVCGDAAGGIYVALAAPATKVVALPGANVQVLPAAAMARVLGRATAKGSFADFLESGVIDTQI